MPVLCLSRALHSMMPMNRPPATDRMRHSTPVPRILAWLLITAGLWALLSDNQGWYIGVPVIVMATGTAALLNTRPWTLRPRHLPVFALFFLYSSLLGGIDVARRTLQPRITLQPGWEVHPLSARDPGVRLALSAIVGLLPGTLASHIEDDALHVHLLDKGIEWQPTLRRLETLLVRLSGTGARS